MVSNVVITDYTYLDFSRYEDELQASDTALIWPIDNREADFLSHLHLADALIHEHRDLTREIVSKLERCRVISHHGKGVDNIDVEEATSRGILVANVLDASMHEVSDHVLALLLGLARGIIPFDRSVRNGGWHVSDAGELHRLNGRVLGLVGFGNIARHVAGKAKAFGMKVIVYARRPSVDLANEFGVSFVDLDTLFAAADVVSLHLPLTSETRGIVSSDRLNRMKPDAFLINVSRGGLIDEEALVDVLSKHKIGGAGLDVLVNEPPLASDPLATMPNVILTPHCAWYSEEGVDEVERRTAREVARVLSGRWPTSLVNPEAKERYVERFGPMND